MDIHDLHDVRDGAAPRRQRVLNPFVHISVDTPLMRLLFSITRPTGQEARLANKRVARKKVVHAASFPAGSMVSYSKKRADKPQL